MYTGSVLPLTFQEATYAKKIYIFDSSSGELEEVIVPVFQELCRVVGSFNEILSEARSKLNDWKGKYIEVKMNVETPVIGAGDVIRNAFAERDGEVLVVRTQFVERDGGDVMSAEEISAKSPEDILAEFYGGKYGDTPDEGLGELMATFKELLDLASTEERD